MLYNAAVPKSLFYNDNYCLFYSFIIISRILAPKEIHNHADWSVIADGGASSPSRAYTSEESLKITEEQLKASAAGQQQAQTSASPESESADGSTSSPSRAYTSEEYLKITEEQLKASAAAQQQAQTSSLPESKSEAQTNPQG